MCGVTVSEVKLDFLYLSINQFFCFLFYIYIYMFSIKYQFDFGLGWVGLTKIRFFVEILCLMKLKEGKIIILFRRRFFRYVLIFCTVDFGGELIFIQIFVLRMC
jgi:hypothetical protein